MSLNLSEVSVLNRCLIHTYSPVFSPQGCSNIPTPARSGNSLSSEANEESIVYFMAVASEKLNATSI